MKNIKARSLDAPKYSRRISAFRSAILLAFAVLCGTVRVCLCARACVCVCVCVCSVWVWCVVCVCVLCVCVCDDAP